MCCGRRSADPIVPRAFPGYRGNNREKIDFERYAHRIMIYKSKTYELDTRLSKREFTCAEPGTKTTNRELSGNWRRAATTGHPAGAPFGPVGAYHAPLLRRGEGAAGRC